MIRGDERLLAGRIKWFDLEKGFGFATTDDGRSDVLIPCRLLSEHAKTCLPAGTRVLCVASQRTRGLMAIRVVAFDLSTAGEGEQDSGLQIPLLNARDEELLRTAGESEALRVAWFDRGLGYGFLLRSDDQQVFIHIRTLRQAGFSDVKPDEIIRGRVASGPRGDVVIAIDSRPSP